MITAFVLIKVAVGSEDIVVDKLASFSNILEAHVVYGIYDVITKIQAENMVALKDFILQNLRKMDLVLATATLIVMES